MTCGNGGRRYRIWAGGRVGEACCSSFRCKNDRETGDGDGRRETATDGSTWSASITYRVSWPCWANSIAAAAVTPKATRQGPPPNATAKDSLRFVAHPDNVPAGFPSNDHPLVLRNPYEGNAQALKTGSQLYVSYNCIDCHGADGSGAMGPSLADSRWHFGGTPPEVFESIYQGRPDGMPTWGGRITNDQIWMLVTYVRSLSAGKDVWRRRTSLGRRSRERGTETA